MNLVGVVLENRYRILDTIGVGGMGTVYLAEHVHLGDLVAVKVLSPLFAWDQEWIDRFLLEARSATRIRQENVVQVKDFGYPAPGLVYMVMEAIRGESLTDLLTREGPIPWRRALRIVDHVAAALEAAHACGIIHRDIKPSNCIRTIVHGDPDFIKVLDFGIAKLTSGNDDSGYAPQTAGGVWMGTAEYMAPEIYRGDQPDARVDIYALGVVLYKLLTNETPFQGTHAQVSRELLIRDATPPSSTAPGRGIPPFVDALVLRALARDPGARTPTMTALRDELAAAFETPVPEESNSLAGFLAASLTAPSPVVASLATPASPGSAGTTGIPTPVGVTMSRSRTGGLSLSTAVVATPGPAGGSSTQSAGEGPVVRRRLTGLLAIIPDPEPAPSDSTRGNTESSGLIRMTSMPSGNEMAASSPAAAIDRAGTRRMTGRLVTMSASAAAAAAAAAAASAANANASIDQTPARGGSPPMPTVPTTEATRLRPLRSTVILAASASLGLLTILALLWRLATPKPPEEPQVVAEVEAKEVPQAEPVAPVEPAEEPTPPAVEPEPTKPAVVAAATEPKPAAKAKPTKTPVPRTPAKAAVLEAADKAEAECRARPGLRADASVTLSLVISKKGSTRPNKVRSNNEGFYQCLRKRLKAAKFGPSKKGLMLRRTFTATAK